MIRTLTVRVDLLERLYLGWSKSTDVAGPMRELGRLLEQAAPRAWLGVIDGGEVLCLQQNFMGLPVESKEPLYTESQLSGVYGADPLACSGCVSGCIRCRATTCPGCNGTGTGTDMGDCAEVACMCNGSGKLPAEPYPHGHELHREVFMARESFLGGETFEDGVRGLIAELKVAREESHRNRVDFSFMTEERDKLLAENKRLVKDSSAEMFLVLSGEVRRLRSALDQARELLALVAKHQLMPDDLNAVDKWLEKNRE